ncbi:MAG: Calx-beta domain-containing protein, partial [Verrucomicrobiota bacterium]
MEIRVELNDQIATQGLVVGSLAFVADNAAEAYIVGISAWIDVSGIQVGVEQSDHVVASMHSRQHALGLSGPIEIYLSAVYGEGSAFDSIRLINLATGEIIPAVASLVSGNLLRVQPSVVLDAFADYQLSIPSDALVDLDGNSVSESSAIIFTTGNHADAPGIARIVAGADHNLLLTADGQVYGWGRSDSGQIGVVPADGSVANRIAPLRDVVNITAGGNTSLAVTRDGRVWQWGASFWDGDGDGQRDSQFTPIVVPGISGAIAVATGGDHGLALTRAGEIYTWGLNDGRLGNGVRLNSHLAQKVEGFERARLVAAGADFSVATRAESSRVALIDGNFGEWSGFGLSVTDGDDQPAGREYPIDLIDLHLSSSEDSFLIGYQFEMPVSLGASQRLLIDADGSSATGLLVNGIGAEFLLEGQQLLGYAGGGSDWKWDFRSTAQAVVEGPVVELAVPKSALGSPEQFRAVFVGANTEFGALEDEMHPESTASPAYVEYTDSLFTVSGAVLEPSSVVSLRGWGRNYSGQLGNDGTVDALRPVPVLGTFTSPYLSRYSPVRQLAAGDRFALALTGDGQVWGWGENTNGAIVHGGAAFVANPAPVSLIGRVSDIATGSNHALAILDDQSLVGWGSNSSGQLAQANLNGEAAPSQIALPNSVRMIAAGRDHSVAVDRFGAIYTWGDNSYGQLGTGDLVSSFQPRRARIRPGPGTFEWESSKLTISESDGAHSLTLNRLEGDIGEVEVSYDVYGLSAVSSADFLMESGVISFRDGDTSKQVSFQVIDDLEVEPDERFKVVLVDASNEGALSDIPEIEVTITDNDGAGVFRLAESRFFIDEEEGEGEIVILRDRGSTGEVTVYYRLVGGSAGANGDFPAFRGMVTFLDGQTEARISIPVLDDIFDEGFEQFSVQLEEPSAGQVSQTLGESQIYIVDAEPGAFRFAQEAWSVDESTQTVQLAIERIGGAEGPATLNLEYQSGSATIGYDFVPQVYSVHFADQQRTATAPVGIVFDVRSERNEVFGVNLTSTTRGRLLGSAASTAVTIGNSSNVSVERYQLNLNARAEIVDGEGSGSDTQTRDILVPLDEQWTIKSFDRSAYTLRNYGNADGPVFWQDNANNQETFIRNLTTNEEIYDKGAKYPPYHAREEIVGSISVEGGQTVRATSIASVTRLGIRTFAETRLNSFLYEKRATEVEDIFSPVFSSVIAPNGFLGQPMTARTYLKDTTNDNFGRYQTDQLTARVTDSIGSYDVPVTDRLSAIYNID